MFNKAIIAAAMLSALSFNAAQAADGQINFTGKILASTCDIGSGAGNEQIDVAMGIYGADAFGAAGSTVGAMPFTIDLSNCADEIKKANVLFDGTRDADNAELIKLSGAAPATGVGIGLYEADGSTKIALGKASADQNIVSKAAKLTFVAKYVSTADQATITTGDADGTAQFTVQYQ